MSESRFAKYRATDIVSASYFVVVGRVDKRRFSRLTTNANFSEMDIAPTDGVCERKDEDGPSPAMQKAQTVLTTTSR